MNPITKIATITNLISEIISIDNNIDCLNVELDFLISHLTNYKNTCIECVALKETIDDSDEEDACICGEEPNKDCDQHCCLQCYDPKTSFNDVAWLCTPCQKVIDDEIDNYTDEEDNYSDTCDCCVMGWNEPNEYGLCNCWCSRCDELLRDCKYKCWNKI